MDNESQDEKRKKENQLHHPWNNNKIKNKKYVNNKPGKSIKNMRRGNR